MKNNGPRVVTHQVGVRRGKDTTFPDPDKLHRNFRKILPAYDKPTTEEGTRQNQLVYGVRGEALRGLAISVVYEEGEVSASAVDKILRIARTHHGATPEEVALALQAHALFTKYKVGVRAGNAELLEGVATAISETEAPSVAARLSEVRKR